MAVRKELFVCLGNIWRSYRKLRSGQYSLPASAIETGSVSTQAINKLRTVAHCRPDRFATMVPATPDDNQQCKYHGKTGAAAHLQDQLHRQQRHDAERHGRRSRRPPAH
jgi:hypothetical protein